MTTPLQNVHADCSKCGKPLSISSISARYSYCYRCKSCGGYSAVYLRDGSVRVEPIRTAHVRLAAGVYFCAAVMFGIPTVVLPIAALSQIRADPFLFASVIFGVVAMMGPCTWVFLWMGILRLRGDPSFGFLHKSIRESATFKKFMQFVHSHGEPIAVAFLAIACWAALALMYRYGGTSVLIAFGTLCGPTTLLLTYFSVGGDIPLKLRQKGIPRLMVIPIVFFLSVFAFMVVVHFLPPFPISN